MAVMDQTIAVVTGAGRGIGQAIAETISSRGATVIAADLDESSARAVADGLKGDATAMPVDVTDKGSVRAMIADTVAAHGRIDVLINNAGWDKAGPFVESDPDDWQRAVNINLFGVLNTCHETLPHMIEHGRGRIVNIASDAGRVGSSGEAVYAAAKGGIIAFSKTIARESARYGINVNCVSPGPTDTALFESVTEGNENLRQGLIKAIPFRRLGQPQDLAQAVAFLASDQASYITGQTLSVSGGLTMC